MSTRSPTKEKTMDLTATPRQLLITANLLEGMHNQPFDAQHTGGNTWVLVQYRADGVWVLGEDASLCWYANGGWDKGAEADFETEIDATAPRDIADATASIISAPTTDERDYRASVEAR
jgi:hypothetical protein